MWIFAPTSVSLIKFVAPEFGPVLTNSQSAELTNSDEAGNKSCLKCFDTFNLGVGGARG
jgi:hypothetical protein